jgi:hypothetical protein
MDASRPPIAVGVGRQLGLGLLQAALFGAPPPRLGRFEVRRKLGEGGMGAVFEALDPALGRVVALKVLREDARGPRPDLAHEARMLARLSHPNVVVVYELGEEAGERYVCMERVDGPNLAAWLAAHPEAPWPARARLLRGAAAGLAAAHRAGLVHRDFKLENVLIGADGAPRVTDFGLARDGGAPEPAGEGPGGDGLAAGAGGPASTLAGTPGYIAPELLQGAPADAKSDQYSFFVALREALRGVRGAVPAGLAQLLHAGLSADPAARLPDMDAVVAALDEALAARPAPDQRAREVLCERVRRLWVEPVRARALAGSGELPLACAPAPELGAGRPVELGEASAEELADALHGLVLGLVLVGEPGAGKTLRLLGVAEALLRRARDNADPTLPVVLNLSAFAAAAGSLSDWLVHELVAKYALPREQAARWLDEGKLALLLDGLDELPPADRSRLVASLDALRAARPTPYLVTCREPAYRELPRPLAADAVLRLCPLAPEALEAALQGPGRAPAVAALAAADPALAERLRNPLLLSLSARLADPLVGPPEALRDRLYALTLAHALGQAPELPPARRAELEAGLRWLARALGRAGRSELWLEELQAAWLPTPGQRLAARALGVGLAFALSLAVNLAASRVAQLPWTSGLFFGLLAAGAAFVIQGGAHIAPMEAMRWSWPRVRAWIPRNLALGLATGGLHGLFGDLWADLLLGVATGLLGLSAIGLVPSGRERRGEPGDGLRESLRNGLLVAPVVGLIIGLPVGYLAVPLARPLSSPGSMIATHPDPELAWAVTMGTSAAVTTAFITGGLAPLLHLALRLVLAATSPLPLRLGPLLDALARRDLLRRVGGGWVFRHATFRAWLAGAAETA